MTRLSAHFTSAELASPDNGLLPSAKFIEHLEALRVVYGKPMRITSGARSPAYNATVSDTGPTGPHVPVGDSCAVDVLVNGPDVYLLVEVAMARGWWGIGLRQHGPLAKRIVHLDNHWNSADIPRPQIWTYPT